MTQQHTPGPWKVADKRDQDLPYVTADRGPVAKTYWLPGPHEAIANARLIAAAPELLAGHHRLMDLASRFRFNSDADVFRFVDEVASISVAAAYRATGGAA